MANLTPDFGSLAPQGDFNLFPIPLSSLSGPAGTSTVIPHVGITSHSEPREECTVNQGYVVKPWNDGVTHKRLKEGNLIINARSEPQNKKFPSMTMLNLYQFNHRLMRIYRKGLVVINSVDNSRIPTSVRLNEIERLRATEENAWYDSNNTDMWRVLNSIDSTKAVQYLTVKGILDNWNILGVMINDMGSENRFKTINVGVKNIVYVDNYWGKDAFPGATLWLVLKRMKLENGTYGSFTLEPIATFKNPSPRSIDRFYKDISGNSQFGPIFHVGRVLDNEYPAPKSDTRLKAIGHKGTEEDGYIASGNSKKIKINFGPPRGRQRQWF